METPKEAEKSVVKEGAPVPSAAKNTGLTDIQKKMVPKADLGEKINLNNPLIKAQLEEQKKKLLEMSEISLWLDTYDDIFSDFDPRPYSQRSLSDDFLFEAKRASREKESGKIQLKLLMPKDKRNSLQEAIIRKRLRENFRKNYNSLQKETILMRRKSIALVFVGAIISFIATYIVTIHFGNMDFIFNFIFVLMEPAGWFTIWTGLDNLFSGRRKLKPNFDFYEKMSKSEISFLPY